MSEPGVDRAGDMMRQVGREGRERRGEEKGSENILRVNILDIF